MPPTIIDPKTQPSGKLVIPNFIESQAPSNMPPHDMIVRWHDMVDEKTVYAYKDADPKSFNAKLGFKPVHVVPLYDVVGNTVEYRFELGMLLRGEDKAWTQYRVDMTDENKGGRPASTPYPCKNFLEAFQAIV